MSPFKRHGSPFYYTAPKVVGFGRLPQRSTETRSKAMAQAIEQTLKELPLLGFGVLVQRVIDGELTPAQVHAAKIAGKLLELREQGTNPPISDLVERYRPKVTDARVRSGLTHLLRLAPNRARLDWLMVPRNIRDLCDELIEEGQKPNSVQRSLWRAISEVLEYQLGRGRKAAIMMEVRRPGEDDSRDRFPSPMEARRLLQRADVEFEALVGVALFTGVDRSPLLRLTPRMIDFQRGIVRIPDTKNRHRVRTLYVGPMALTYLARVTAGKAEDDRLWPWSRWQVRKRWDRLREAAGCPDLRFKDLRHGLATAWTECGGSLKSLSGYMGHRNSKTTLGYIAGQPQGDPAFMATIEDWFGARPMRIDQEDIA